MKLDATIVVPAIVILATLIVGWLLAWLDIREYRREIAELTRKAKRLENDFWEEHETVGRLVNKAAELKVQISDLEERNRWLEQLATREESSDLIEKQRRIARAIESAPAGDEQSPQSQSSSWQVQSYYASHPTLAGKNPQEASFGKSGRGS